MIIKIIQNQNILKNIYYNKLDKLRETFDFNNQTSSFEIMEIESLNLKNELKNHFELQEKLRYKINNKVDKLILENLLVKDILIRMCSKITLGAQNKDVNIFNFFDDFEEILRAYLLKEKGLFIQELEMATNEEEKKKIKNIL